jgi:hypothetical protein
VRFISFSGKSVWGRGGSVCDRPSGWNTLTAMLLCGLLSGIRDVKIRSNASAVIPRKV